MAVTAPNPPSGAKLLSAPLPLSTAHKTAKHGVNARTWQGHVAAKSSMNNRLTFGVLCTPEVVEHIVKLARKGLTSTEIGVTIRDSRGIPQVCFLTVNNILRILKGQDLGHSIPEDLSGTFYRLPYRRAPPTLPNTTPESHQDSNPALQYLTQPGLARFRVVFSSPVPSRAAYIAEYDS
ncbi:Ribosomal protein S13 [Mycena chlorophos]|uniref:Ribosomal protein S13 n=1 Tax=Mycena chlorophos TaxID=658473 RepID=A0A8H6TBY5_MYCCL|nr:Ribosomal protein S13 [Mycena chlorophos]